MQTMLSMDSRLRMELLHLQDGNYERTLGSDKFHKLFGPKLK